MLRVVAVTAAITPIGITGCASEADKETINAMVSTTTTFERDTFPFTFEYPDGFEFTDEWSASRTVGRGADESVAIAMDEDNLLLISRITLDQEINQGNLGLAKQDVDELFQQVDPDARGAEGEIAGFPSLTYDAVTLTTPEELEAASSCSSKATSST
jgi:hypothetical protein